jgi:hypothetical protein
MAGNMGSRLKGRIIILRARLRAAAEEMDFVWDSASPGSDERSFFADAAMVVEREMWDGGY